LGHEAAVDGPLGAVVDDVSDFAGFVVRPAATVVDALGAVLVGLAASLPRLHEHAANTTRITPMNALRIR
jgi:hypothetical protein